MKLNSLRSNSWVPDYSNVLVTKVAEKLVGQQPAIDAIVPFIQMHQAGLAPEGRPVGVFMLLGPTGTGKTRTVEVLAEVLHGSAKKMLKVDCGEFQMEHEVAKLVGAPPGYLGHRETQPLLTQQKINSVSSESSDLSIVLFDEIEKAAGSMSRILLGILDKAVLRLGDNTTVNFEKSLIFLTSNLGARNMSKELHPQLGFEAYVPKERTDTRNKLQRIGMNAVRRKFSPEFINRIDAIVTYQTLNPEAMAAILEQQLFDLQTHIIRRLGPQAFRIDVPAKTRRHLLKVGTSDESGARELKRTIQRQLIQPLAVLVSDGQIPPRALVRVDVNDARTKLVMRIVDEEFEEPAA
jgi:ATP-dependent Clp protease ATP-binding subunit ClpA